MRQLALALALAMLAIAPHNAAAKKHRARHRTPGAHASKRTRAHRPTRKHAEAPVSDLDSAVAERRREPEPELTATAPPPPVAATPAVQAADDEVPGQPRRK